MKIAITGTFGTGKTTQLFGQAAELKQKFPNKSIGIIQEIARYCPFPVNEKASLDTQVWIFGTQLKTEIEYALKYDIIICDRTIIDSLAYSYAIGLGREADLMLKLGLEYLKTYDKIYFRTIAQNNYLVDDGFRSMDREFQKSVENWIMNILHSPESDIFEWTAASWGYYLKNIVTNKNE